MRHIKHPKWMSWCWKLPSSRGSALAYLRGYTAPSILSSLDVAFILFIAGESLRLLWVVSRVVYLPMLVHSIHMHWLVIPKSRSFSIAKHSRQMHQLYIWFTKQLTQTCSFVEPRSINRLVAPLVFLPHLTFLLVVQALTSKTQQPLFQSKRGHLPAENRSGEFTS